MEKLKSLQRVEESLNKLPSIGKKSAERMAYALLEMSEEDINEFSQALANLKKNIAICPICGMLSEDDKCPICNDETRDHTSLMVVSYPKDVISLERSEGYKGLYHILNGEISMGKGKGVEDLNIPNLLDRVSKGTIKEVIIATNPTIDGETTSLYISKLLAKYPVEITRLAFGLQMGGNIDYTDQLTLLKALEGRRKI